jgi:hypothetical protein
MRCTGNCGWIALVAVVGCSSHVSLGHGELGASAGGAMGQGGSGATGIIAQPLPRGCEHRAGTFAPTTVYQGYVQNQAIPSNYADILLAFTELDAGGVNGRVTIGSGASSYVDATTGSPAGAALSYRPGFDYTIAAGSLTGNRLHLELGLAEPWCALCGSQSVYPDRTPGAAVGYGCMPSGYSACVDPPECTTYSVVDPVTAKVTQVSRDLFDLCTPPSPCGCSASGCGACGFPITGSCTNPKIPFDLVLSGEALTGSATIGDADHDVVTHPSSHGIVSLAPGKLAALESAACQGWEAQPEAAPLALELVVDLSAPMARAAANGVGTNWDATRDALRSAVAALPDSALVGVSFYPNQPTQANAGPSLPATACISSADDVGLGLLGSTGSTQRALIDDALQRVEPDAGAGAPTEDAYRLGLTTLVNNAPSAAKCLVLVTDGQPTFSLGCIGSGLPSDPVSEKPIIADITSARANSGTLTLVVGTPGSEANQSTGADARSWLSAAARAGGAAPSGCSDTGPAYCHLDMTAQLDLPKTLVQTIGATVRPIVSCVYLVPPAPAGAVLDPSKTELVYRSGSQIDYTVIRNDADPCVDGWHYVNNGAEIEICSDTCALLQSDPRASVKLFFGCGVPVLH